MDALRKCVVLGGKSGSEELRDWATRELKGYGSEDDLPDYRVVAAPLRVDALKGNYKITNQAFPPSSLPEFARDDISDEVHLRDGIGGIEALLKLDEIRLGLPMGSDLVSYINSQVNDPFQHIDVIYWQPSPAAIVGLLDQVRTSLTQLVAELRATMPQSTELPTSEAADQAVQVVVTGKRNTVALSTAQTTGSHAPAAASPTTAQPRESPFWTRSRRIGAGVVGLASLATAVVAVIEFL